MREKAETNNEESHCMTGISGEVRNLYLGGPNIKLDN